MTLIQRILISLALVAGMHCKDCCKGPHERYTNLGPACIGDGCHPLINIRECDQIYQAGCFCECGFFRDFNGECVPAEKCPGGVINVEYPKSCPGHQCTGQNEHYTLSNSCVELCPNQLIACLPYQNTLGCYCLPGYKRNPSGKCVPEAECCTNTCNGENEYFTESNICVDQCPPTDGSTCAALWNNPGCFCRPGFKRAVSGLCIPENQCPPQQQQQCTRPFEEFTSSNQCVDNCPAIDGSVCNALLNNPGCWCVQGYKRDLNGRCIQENECPIQQKCPGRYEYFTESNFCDDQCPPIDGSVCNALWNNPGCFCRPGFKRSTSGLCIPEKHCPTIYNCTARDPNSEPGCGVGCQTCQQQVDFYLMGTQCPTETCGPCKCIDGYHIDDFTGTNLCIPLTQCLELTTVPTDVCFEPHKTTRPCPEGHCPLCSHLVGMSTGNPIPCPNICVIEVCHCQEGYYEDRSGKCVTADVCFQQA